MELGLPTLDDLCEGDGECGTDWKLDNCGTYDVYKVTTPNNDLMSELIPFEKEDSVCSLNVASLPNCNACGLSFGNTRPLPLSPARLLPYIFIAMPRARRHAHAAPPGARA